MVKKNVKKAGKGVVSTVKFSASSKEVVKAYTGYQMGLASVREGFFNFLAGSFTGITKDTKKSDLVKAVPEDVRMKVQNFLYSWCEVQANGKAGAKGGKLVLLKESKRPVAAGSSAKTAKGKAKANGKAGAKDSAADLEKALNVVSDNIATLKSLKAKAAALAAVQELFKAFGIR